MIIENDPFKKVIEVFEKLYPDKQAKIFFMDTDEWKAYGVTFFNINQLPIIWIDPDYSVRKATEVLIHELAHVAVGYEANHGPEFEKAKNTITNKYNELNRS